MRSLETILDYPINFGDALRHPATVSRAMIVSAIVGTILVAIGQGDLILAGITPPYWKVILTYLVPFSVSSYSSAAFMAAISNMAADRIENMR